MATEIYITDYVFEKIRSYMKDFHNIDIPSRYNIEFISLHPSHILIYFDSIHYSIPYSKLC